MLVCLLQGSLFSPLARVCSAGLRAVYSCLTKTRHLSTSTLRARLLRGIFAPDWGGGVQSLDIRNSQPFLGLLNKTQFFNIALFFSTIIIIIFKSPFYHNFFDPGCKILITLFYFFYIFINKIMLPKNNRTNTIY